MSYRSALLGWGRRDRRLKPNVTPTRSPPSGLGKASPMRDKPFRGVCSICICLSLGARGGPQLGRVGPVFALPNGSPRSQCEAKGWYEMAQTRLQTQTTEGTGDFTSYYSRLFEGVGIYRPREEQPLDLVDVWPDLRDRELEKRHQARIKPVDDANVTSLYWMLGALGTLVATAGTAAAIRKESRTAAVTIAVGGLVVSTAGMAIGWAKGPSPSERMTADARRKLLFPEGRRYRRCDSRRERFERATTSSMWRSRCAPDGDDTAQGRRRAGGEEDQRWRRVTPSQTKSRA